MITYVAITEGIQVSVRPLYLADETNLMEKRFVFGYFVRIENHTSEEVQLLRRQWFIYDGHGRCREVEGRGVVGKQPIIQPGGAHEYGSYCVLPTFEGAMEGFYLMERPNGERFRVAIPRFTLRAAAN